MLIESLFSQVFNMTFYGIVDAMLLDAHVKRSRLDINDFVHIKCAYLPRASRGKNHFVIVFILVDVPASSAPLLQPPAGVFMPPPALAVLENPSTTPFARPPSTRLSPNRADLDYTEYLNERSPLQDSGFADPMNPYGSDINHGGGGLPTSIIATTHSIASFIRKRQGAFALSKN